jgi:hypothetical protein
LVNGEGEPLRKPTHTHTDVYRKGRVRESIVDDVADVFIHSVIPVVLEYL